MKSIEKDEIKALKANDAIMSVLLVSVCVAVIAYITSNNLVDMNKKRAQLDLESLSTQIMMGGLKVLPEVASEDQKRGIASIKPNAPVEKNFIGLEGKIGSDPWNNPYHYKIVQKGKGIYTHIVIWSEGPNKSDDSGLKTKDIDLPTQFYSLFRGDDLGYIRSFQ